LVVKGGAKMILRKEPEEINEEQLGKYIARKHTKTNSSARLGQNETAAGEDRSK
jgi:hypothetical protein